MRFSAQQKRSLETALRLFEERLRQADACLQGTTTQGNLYREVMPLSPEQRAAARARISEALAEIAALSDALSLECEVQDMRATVRATMSASWADLLDTRTGRLAGYGPVDPELPAVWDPIVERLADLAMVISALMNAD